MNSNGKYVLYNYYYMTCGCELPVIWL